MSGVPQGVLPESLGEAIGSRRVLAAVFTTFQLQPGFFEDSVLPLLVGQEPAPGDRVLRAILHDKIRDIDEVLVFYDRSALVADRTPRQAVALVPVTWGHKVLHAKHAILLLADDGGRPASLVSLTTSANLTKAGWWSNVEVADIEKIEVGKPTTMKGDLLDLLSVLRGMDPGGIHPALDRIEAFVAGTGAAEGLPRMWTGRQPLADFVRAVLGETSTDRIEAFAPFVGSAAPLRALAKALSPRILDVRMPTDDFGGPAASDAWRDEVLTIPGARFADLPVSVDLSHGKGTMTKRYVHAKVLRIVSADRKRAWLVTGSPNLTEAGSSGRETGNLETAIVREAPLAPDWLKDVDKPPKGADETHKAPEEQAPWRLIELRLRYDWSKAAGEYRLERPAALDVRVHRSGAAAGGVLIEARVEEEWAAVSADVSDWLRRELTTTNLVYVSIPDHEPMPLLVEEVGRLHRPDFLHGALTPADILRYWSLRDVSAEEAHLAALVARLGGGEGEVTVAPAFIPGGATMFDKAAGIFHAFLSLGERLDEMNTKRRDSALVGRLLGHGHDAVPTLLAKVLEDPTADRIDRLLILMCARETVTRIRRKRPDLFLSNAEADAALCEQLGHIDLAWSAIDLGVAGTTGIDPVAFRDWYETSFSAAEGK